MEAYADRTMDRMSDGECQRILIARALAQQTPVILLDEPDVYKRQVENLQTSISYPGVGDINTTGNLGTYEWLNIEKIDKKTLQIKVERNAGTIRKMRIAVTCGDFFDYIVVTQKGLD